MQRLFNECRINDKYTLSTHLSMGNFKSKLHFSRDKLETFFSQYDPKKHHLCLAEKPQHYSPVLVDIDLKWDKQTMTNVSRSDKHIHEVIKVYQNVLNSILTGLKPKDLTCVFLDKKMYETTSNNKTVMKNGFHLHFPYIFTDKETHKNYIIPKVRDEINKLQTFKDLGFENSGAMIDDVTSNAWLVYGCVKQEGLEPYTVSKVYNNFVEEISLSEGLSYYPLLDKSENIINLNSEKDIVKNLPRILSIIPILRDHSVIKDRRMDLEPPNKITKKKSERKRDFDNNKDLEQILKEAKELCSMISSDRANDRSDWLKIGWILYNISDGDDEAFTIWNDFSAQCDDKYDEAVCDYHWERMNQGELTIATLHYFAKTDNPDKYNEFIKTILPKNEWTPPDSISLEDIKPDEIINQNNIGSYIPRLEKNDVCCMRSNMMTFKTQNLKELFKHYKRVLILSFRVSLENEYMETFKDYDFKLYSDCKGIIREDRVVCQIDSLWKVRGEYDLLVLDEIDYTLEHLHSFVKKKQEVWDALNQFIQSTSKIIACDALLSKRSINLFKNNDRSTWVVENKWCSFKGKTVNFLDYVNAEQTIAHILEQQKLHGSVFVPTNSKTFAQKLFLFLKKKGIKVCLDSGDEDPTPSSEWKNFDVFITTPVNVAGVSCNDPFGKMVSYFTSSSCNAESASQMMHRVRNIICSEYDVFIKSNTMGRHYPLKTQDIKQWLTDKDDLILHSGLKINYIRDTIVEDDYYNNFVQHIRKENLSKVCFKKVLKGILEAHGVFENEPVEQPSLSSEEILEKLDYFDAVKKQTKQLHDKHKHDERVSICNSKQLSEQEYKELSEKYRKTLPEKMSIRRYNIESAYGNNIKLTGGFVKTFEKLIPQYRNLQIMNCKNLKDFIEYKINEHEKTHRRDENIQRLHERRGLLKIWVAHNIVEMLGFKDIFDTKTIDGYPYEKAKDFLIKHSKNIDLLFNTQSSNWEELDITDKDGKNKLSNYISGKLKAVCNITFSNAHRGKKAQLDQYILKGMEIWQNGNIQIPKNHQAHQLYLQNNFKRITTKIQVNDKLWKVVSKLIEVENA
jgi:hypothetical protein